jgi:DNA-binding transcriptional MerR regulator
MLTISQLADHVGVTVRAVRHYHQRGLLAEPGRDASGYRRYGAQAVIDLIRIKTLTDAGVPLARVAELLDAEPERFSQAVAEIDAALAQRIRDLRRHRRSLADLAGGERLFLPAEVVDFLDRLRVLGVGARTVQMERDNWIMLSAHSPGQVPGWIAQKRADLADPLYQRLYLAYDQALDWDVDDPRLERLVEEMEPYLERQLPGGANAGSAATELVASHTNDYSPAWERLNRLAAKKIAELSGRG